MTLDYTEKGKAKIKMLDYLVRMFEDLPEAFSGETSSPAANHLFTVDDNQMKLDEKRAQLFHTYVAKTISLQTSKARSANNHRIFMYQSTIV
jgi:hypothetical protein